MKFLLDMGISPKVEAWLVAEGYEALHIREVNPTALDSEIVQLAREIAAIVLTADKDFSSLLATSGEKSPSVILFRIVPAPAGRVIELLRPVLEDYAGQLAQGCLITIAGNSPRLRLLPIRPA